MQEEVGTMPTSSLRIVGRQHDLIPISARPAVQISLVLAR
jgi:hypothetical protein